MQLANRFVAAPVAAIEIECGRSESGEDQASAHIDAEAAPGIGCRRDLSTNRPSQVSCPNSPGPGHRAKPPDFLARADIERTDVARVRRGRGLRRKKRRR